jgi:membrane-associated phospholipid phosphatase
MSLNEYLPSAPDIVTPPPAGRESTRWASVMLHPLIGCFDRMSVTTPPMADVPGVSELAGRGWANVVLAASAANNGISRMRRITPMRISFVSSISLLACLSVAPARLSAQDLSAQARGAQGDRSFVQTIADNLKSVVSKESASLLSAATAFALFASPFDDNLTYSASCSTFLKTTFEPWARVVGQEWLLGSGALATYAIGHAFDRPRLAAVGGDLIEAQLVAGVSTFALKHAIRRTRPDGEPRSFPSGHASGTFAAATVVQRHFGLKGAIPAYTAAVLITGARMQANSHYPTDLIMGAAVGILSGRAATFELGHRRVRFSPSATDGGLALVGTIH